MYGIIMRPFDRGENPSPSSQLRIRCPYCFQIFKALKAEFEQDQPDFGCSVCHKEFWIEAQDNSSVVLGKPSTMQKPDKAPPASKLGVSHKICPRCTEEVPMDLQSCTYCGVVFIKMIEGWGSSFQLRGMWAKVVSQWHSENRHNEFLQECQKRNELVYGISCYGRILKEDKNNQKALEMIKRMEALTWFFEEESPAKPNPGLIRIWNFLQSHIFDALALTAVLCFFIYLFS